MRTHTTWPLRSARRATAIAALVLGMPAAVAAQPAPAPGAPADAALIERGRYLAVAADCTACHTAKGGKPYAGGYSVESPLGTIYATNITPSKTAGIGNYTEAQFARALRQGIRADGAHLYPAMPYTAYTAISDEDVHALYLYFMQGVEPVDTEVARTRLPFPFNLRLSMAAWNLLFLKDERFQPDAGASEEVNRGAYLANALAHCSTCHTPRNALMAERESRFLAGSGLGAWYAPNITPHASGIGGWSDEDLVRYLRTGHAAGKGQAAGPMAEAVENSFQHLRPEDLQAMVAYLRTVRPVADEGAPARPAYAQGRAFSSEAELRGTHGPNERDSLKTGAALYSAHCASCHQADGSGSANQRYPSLFHNTATGGPNPANLVAVMLYGVERDAGGEHALMPRFDGQSYVSALSDEQIAAISNYVLAQYGNGASRVSGRDVAIARQGGPRPLLAKVQPFIVWTLIGVAILVVVLAALLLTRRRRRRSTIP